MLEPDHNSEKTWDRRARNFSILIAAQGTNATRLANSAGLSPNTLTKFLSRKTLSLSSRSLDNLLPLIGLKSIDQLDTDNPINDPRVAIVKTLDGLSDAEIYRLLEELQARYK